MCFFSCPRLLTPLLRGNNRPARTAPSPSALCPALRHFPEPLGFFRNRSALSGLPRLAPALPACSSPAVHSLSSGGWGPSRPHRTQVPILSEAFRLFPSAGRPFCGADVISGPPYKKAGAGGARCPWRRARSRRGSAAHRAGEAAGGRGDAVPAFIPLRSGRQRPLYTRSAFRRCGDRCTGAGSPQPWGRLRPALPQGAPRGASGTARLPLWGFLSRAQRSLSAALGRGGKEGRAGAQPRIKGRRARSGGIRPGQARPAAGISFSTLGRG